MRRRRGGGTGGEGGDLPSAPSPLTQIVPNLASIYSVFHSVNYNSVRPRMLLIPVVLTAYKTFVLGLFFTLKRENDSKLMDAERKHLSK